MTWLLPEQIAALVELQQACGRWSAEVVIIGATAYRAWFNDPDRYTEDVDVAVAVDLEEFLDLVEALAGLGWRQEPRREHRWQTPAGARVDLLPAGRKLRAVGRIEWPQSGMVMNLVGFEHVFGQAATRVVAPATVVRVIPVPVLALLKIAAFLDMPHAREKDAQDIFSILERYELDGDRRFGPALYDAGVDYQRAGAFLLGQDLATLCNGTELELVARFVRAVQDDSAPEAKIFARVAGRPALNEYGPDRCALIAAFAAGLSQGQR